MKTESEKSLFRSLIDTIKSFSDKDLPQLIEEVLKGDYQDFREFLRKNKISSVTLWLREKSSECCNPPFAGDHMLMLNVWLKEDNLLHIFKSLQDVGITIFSVNDAGQKTPELINHIFNYLNGYLESLSFNIDDNSMSPEMMALLMLRAKDSDLKNLHIRGLCNENTLTVLANNLKDLKIHTLTLSRTGLNDITLNILGSCLKETTINHLDISCNDITDKGIIILLTQPNLLRTLCFFGNDKISKEKSATINQFFKQKIDNLDNNAALSPESDAVTYLVKRNIAKDKAQVLETNTLLRKPKLD